MVGTCYLVGSGVLESLSEISPWECVLVLIKELRKNDSAQCRRGSDFEPGPRSFDAKCESGALVFHERKFDKLPMAGDRMPGLSIVVGHTVPRGGEAMPICPIPMPPRKRYAQFIPATSSSFTVIVQSNDLFRCTNGTKWRMHG